MIEASYNIGLLGVVFLENDGLGQFPVVLTVISHDGMSEEELRLVLYRRFLWKPVLRKISWFILAASFSYGFRIFASLLHSCFTCVRGWGILLMTIIAHIRRFFFPERTSMAQPLL
jgi:hypothetical protein